MIRRIVSIILILSVLLATSINASASDELPFVIDNASLFSTDEITILEERIQQIRAEYQYDVVILTENSLCGKSAHEYADDFFDTHGYGMGDEHSGILFLLSIEEREWYISTTGNAIVLLKDSAIQKLGKDAFSCFENDNYADVFQSFLMSLHQYCNSYDISSVNNNEDPYLGYYQTDKGKSIFHEDKQSPNIFLSFVIGLIVAIISIFIMRSTMNTRHSQPGAANYITEDSFQLTMNQDIFLYSRTKKVRRQQNTSNSSKGSIRTSSSGRRHGGNGGRF